MTLKKMINWILNRVCRDLINEAYTNGFLDGAETILRRYEND
jgi:hypothetical protein